MLDSAEGEFYSDPSLSDRGEPCVVE